MRNDYKNVNGLVTGVRALLKKEGIKIGHWYKSGRIKGMSHFSNGVEVKNGYDEVIINFDSIRELPIEKVTEILERHEIEYRVGKDSFGHERVYIPAKKYVESIL